MAPREEHEEKRASTVGQCGMGTGVWLLFFLLSNVEAETRLAEIKAHFSSRPVNETVADLERLVRDSADGRGQGLATVWLGELTSNETWFVRAVASPLPEIEVRGLRGQGDLLLKKRRYAAAGEKYRQALEHAEGLIKVELVEKSALTSRLAARARLEWAAFIVLGLCVLWLGRALAPFSELKRRPFPSELLYVLPVYALLVLGSLAQPAIFLTLLGCAIGSALLIGLSGFARPPARRRDLVLRLVVVGGANFALFYIALCRGGLLDPLLHH